MAVWLALIGLWAGYRSKTSTDETAAAIYDFMFIYAANGIASALAGMDT